MHGLTQRIACVVSIVLGPEQREQGVARVPITRRSEREIGQQRDTPGLRERAPQLLSIRVLQIEGAERSKTDHGPTRER